MKHHFVDSLHLIAKGKAKVCRIPQERQRGAHLPFQGREPIGGR